MAGINTGRLVASGLAAGLVVNVVESIANLSFLAAPMEELQRSLNREPLGGAAMGGFVVLGFALGFVVAWVYAAIRPRYGPGPATGIKAGLAVWVAFYLLGIGANWLMTLVPTGLFVITLVYSLVMMAAAGYVAGMVYREE